MIRKVVTVIDCSTLMVRTNIHNLKQTQFQTHQIFLRIKKRKKYQNMMIRPRRKQKNKSSKRIKN